MRKLLAAVALAVGLAPVIVASPAGAATGHVCADADSGWCVGAPVLQHGAAVIQVPPASARNLIFTAGAGGSGTLSFLAASGLCLRAPGGSSLNVVVGNTTGDAGVNFTWLNATAGGHYFYNPHTGLYLSITGNGAVVTVEAKGKPGWDQRFDGP
jgi:hypothetical protein